MNDASEAPVQGLTQRQAADALGKSLGRVNGLVRDGVLELLPSGRIDPASLDKARGLVSKPAARAPARDGQTFAHARLEKEHWNAREAALDYHERVGTLVNKASIDADQQTAARILRDELLSVPATVAPGLIGVTDQRIIEHRVREGILRALATLSQLSPEDAARRAAA